MPAMTTNNPPAKSSNYWQQTAQNRMLLVVLGMVVFVPLLASPENLRMQAFAAYALRVMAGLLAGILVLRARVATRRAEVITFLSVGANLAVVLFFLDSLLSLLTSTPDVRRFGAVDFMRVVTGTLLYFALAYHVRRSEHLVKIQDALVWVSGLMALAGLAGMVTRAYDLRANLFGDHQLFGAFLMILFPIALVAALTERDVKRQLPAQVAAALTAICLLMTGTRTAWLGGLIEIIALPLFSLIGTARKKSAPTPRQQYLIPILIVLACGGLFTALGGFGGTLATRIGQDSQNASLAYRQRMWYAASELVKTAPAFGHGLGSYALLQEQYSLYGRTGATMLRDANPSLGEMAHNFWLQMAAEQGLVGVAFFALIVISFLWQGARRLRFMEGGIRRSLLLACLAAVCGFSVDAIGNPAWQFAQVSMFFWLVLGIGVASLRPRNSRHEG